MYAVVVRKVVVWRGVDRGVCDLKVSKIME